MKHENYGSHFADKGSYGKPLDNCPGYGCGHMPNPGSYATTDTKSFRGRKRSPEPRPPKSSTRNNPGHGAGHNSSKPVGGKKGQRGRGLGRMTMDGY